jgi:phthiocerol/phenolphthiocerol synthesis type-I polyketide synthase D
MGMTSIDPEVGLEILGRAMVSPAAQLGVLPVEPAAWNRFAPGGHAPPYLAALIRANHGAGPAAQSVTIASALDRAALLAAPIDDWQSILESQLREQAARVLKLAPSALDVEQSLSGLGIDSLMAIELKNRIEADLGATVPMVKFLEGPSVRDLSEYLATQLVPLNAQFRGSQPAERGGQSNQNGHAARNGHANSNGHSHPSSGKTEAIDAGQLLARLDTLSDAEVDSLLQGLCDAEKGD